MSLLLEALKKAEKAKEEAQRRADAAAPAESSGLQLVDDPQPTPAPQPRAERRMEARIEPRLEPAEPAQPKKKVLTRDALPELSQSIDIAADDLAVEQPAEPTPRGRDSAPRPAPAEARDAERASAKKVFEAKFREPNPRLPFFITMGVLGAFAVGTVIYFWMQLRPPAPLVNLNPQRAAQEAAKADAAPAAPKAATPAPAASQPIPGLPGTPAPSSGAPAVAAAPTPPAPAPAASAPQAPASVPPVPEAGQVSKPAATLKPTAPLKPRLAAALAAPDAGAAEERRAQPAPQSPAQPSVQTTRQVPTVHPQVDAGYQAYMKGDLGASRAAYQQALAEDPGNRDAILGTAALDVRAGRLEAAEVAYLRLLQADPRDAQAQAALISVRSGRVDPLAAESRVKSMLAADPGAHVLNFALGNQLAQQGRWAEAQQEYFKAAAAEPENPDFAYNLAVSLDHLRQPRLAREYYGRAIQLAEKRGASFDLAAARARLAQIPR